MAVVVVHNGHEEDLMRKTSGAGNDEMEKKGPLAEAAVDTKVRTAREIV